MSELVAVSGAVAAAEAEHAPTPVQLLAASVTGGAPAPTLSASAVGLPDAGHRAAGGGLQMPRLDSSDLRPSVAVSVSLVAASAPWPAAKIVPESVTARLIILCTSSGVWSARQPRTLAHARVWLHRTRQLRSKRMRVNFACFRYSVSAAMLSFEPRCTFGAQAGTLLATPPRPCCTSPPGTWPSSRAAWTRRSSRTCRCALAACRAGTAVTPCSLGA